MSTTKSVLNPRIQNRIQPESQNTFMPLETNNEEQNRKSISSSARLVFNNFVACDNCFGYNPLDNIPLSSTYVIKACPECGNKGVRYISTASNKLFDYVHKNIY